MIKYIFVVVVVHLGTDTEGRGSGAPHGKDRRDKAENRNPGN